MEHTTNKLLLLMICFMIHLSNGFAIGDVFPLLCALALSFSMDLWRDSARLCTMPLVCAVYFIIPNYIYYLPLYTYDLYRGTSHMRRMLPLAVIVLSLQHSSLLSLTLLLCFMVSGAILKERHLRMEALLTTYKKQRDATQEVSILMEEKHHDLMQKQEYEIRLATLNERTRIAREIHDNVGHLLSSSLLQLGAVEAINAQASLQEPLSHIKETLNDAMNSIRSSVHDLHDDALDLEMEIQKLISSFAFCEISFQYECEHPLNKEVIYHMLAIIKEGMNNVIKHSNATLFHIVFREHPKFYQLILHDNGTISCTHSPGIGLVNMRQRVEQYHGVINMTNHNGFRIFITIPKEETV